MTLLDTVKTFTMSLKKLKLNDKTKAENIKQFILDIPKIADCTRKNLFSQIKSFIVENKILKNKTFISLVNCTELYDRVIKQTDANREATKVVQVDTEVIAKILNLKYDKELNRKNGEFQINRYSLLAYLLFTSGMRTNEVVSNSFTIIDYNTIKAERISKNDDNCQENLINLLVPASQWIELFNQLQKQFNEFNSNPALISMGIKRKLNAIHPDLHAHSLRKLYLAYHLQVKKTGADKMPSINTKKLLNHSGENASVFYNGAIKITGDLADIIDNTDYSKLKVLELKQILNDKQIKYNKNMKKAELIALVTYEK